MEKIKFVWDENKNRINQKKHKVSFEEAKTVFEDEEAIVFDDPEHSGGEERFLIIGFTSKARLCIVSHCYRENDSIIRLISARKATASERAYYNEENGGQ